MSQSCHGYPDNAVSRNLTATPQKTEDNRVTAAGNIIFRLTCVSPQSISFYGVAVLLTITTKINLTVCEFDILRTVRRDIVV